MRLVVMMVMMMLILLYCVELFLHDTVKTVTHTWTTVPLRILMCTTSHMSSLKNPEQILNNDPVKPYASLTKPD